MKSTNSGRERWRAIPGYEGLYEVSDQGRVLSLARVVPGRWGSQRVSQKRMACPADDDGYQTVTLSKNGEQRTCNVHRLVLLAFKPRHDSDNFDVNHKDGNPANSRLKNLEWMTRGENISHAFKVLGVRHAMRDKFGELHPRAIGVQAFDPIGGVIVAEYGSLSEAQRDGYLATKIGNCLRGDAFTHRGLCWKAKNSRV